MSLVNKVAIKVIRHEARFRKQAQVEIALLEELNRADKGNRHIVRLLRTFEHRGHVCLVFERMSVTLYEVIANTGFKGVSLNLTRKFASQILSALDFLRSPKIAIIHCDLKPENIVSTPSELYC